MKRFLLLVLPAVLVIAACGKFGAATPDALELSLTPGECLESTTLRFWENYGFVTHSGRDNGFGIRLSLDIDTDHMVNEVVSRVNGVGRVRVYRLCPGDAEFASFGNDSNAVKDSYYSIVNTCLSTDGLIQLTTVYSDGSFSLRANTSFAGIEAGEELSGLAYLAEVKHPYSSPFPVNPPQGMVSLPRNIEIIIPLNDREIIDDTVVMHVEIPVKVGMLLHTLQDRLTNPDAAMQYRDVVLTGNFTIPKNLE